MLRHKKLVLFLSLFMIFLLSSTCMYFLSKDGGSKKSVVVTKPSPVKILTEEPIKQDTVSEVLISCAGDCTIGTDDKFTYNTLPTVLEKNNNDFSYFFKNVKSIFSKDDLTTANLETTFTTSNSKLFKGDPPFYNFKGDPSYAKSLTLGSIEAVTISNNHIHDYLDQGLNDTITALKNNNINYFGEGNKYVTTIKGIQFGFLGYMGFSNDSTFLKKVKNDIAELKSQNCIVIVNFHWGQEGSYTPNEVQTNIAHFAIDNGADLIIGHHPHVIQGIEQYKNKFICYSLGNFCFGGNQNPPDKDTFIFQVKYKFTNDKLTSSGIKVIPCSISSVTNTNDYCPTPLVDTRKTEFMNKLIKYSPNLNLTLTDDFSFINVNN